VIAVAHREFLAMKPADLRRLARRKHVLYDIKHVFRRQDTDGRL
jgi:UDP-N-acetyl-D-galactosamine dehydrogenase